MLTNDVILQQPYFIGNLDPNVTEDELKQIFRQLGEISYVRIPATKGCGFVQFVARASAEETPFTKLAKKIRVEGVLSTSSVLIASNSCSSPFEYLGLETQ
ncbi:hypothetical protein POM88_055036 [Heracleum sosnowskyi]|uniref:RRM domain-containing protein n=1 Tax=Heracleum sosnowskyi TaxID=360622 RepID=A0AAD8LVK7_9APIA|nr:hypothetical protein POM88_055036 [Heracleum sosnowskyi]